MYPKNTVKDKTNTKWQLRIAMNSREGGKEGSLHKVKIFTNKSEK